VVARVQDWVASQSSIAVRDRASASHPDKTLELQERRQSLTSPLARTLGSNDMGRAGTRPVTGREYHIIGQKTVGAGRHPGTSAPCRCDAATIPEMRVADRPALTERDVSELTAKAEELACAAKYRFPRKPALVAMGRKVTPDITRATRSAPTL
jgi:hypothetical protein